MTDSSTSGRLFSDDQLNFSYLFHLLKLNKRKIIVITAIFTVFAIIIGITTPKEYTASTIFVPRNTGGSKIGGNLGGLAAIAGINLNSSDGSGEISPILYPKILASLEFQKKVTETPIYVGSLNRTIPFKEYYLVHKKPSFAYNLKKYTIGLPGLLINAIKGDQEAVEITKNVQDSLPRLTKDDQKLRNVLNKQILLEIKEEEGYLILEALMPEAIQAAQMADATKSLLQDAIIELYVEKAKIQLAYLEKRLDEKAKEFARAQVRLANFKDKNLFSNTARSLTQLEELQSERDLVFGVYSELSKQVENQRLQVKKDTPVFMTIQSSVVPREPSSQGLLKTIIIGMFLGFAVSVGFIILKELFYTVKQSEA